MVKTVSIKEYSKDDRGALTDNAVVVLENRYLDRDDSGELIETPSGMFHRVARHVSSVEDSSTHNEWHHKFYDMMWSQKFMPNSPTLMNAGRRLGMLSACASGDSPILTSTGYRSVLDVVQSVESGEQVLVASGKGDWVPVLATKRNGKRQTYDIKTSVGRSLWLTEDHRVWVGTSKSPKHPIEFSWVQVKDIEAGDNLYYGDIPVLKDSGGELDPSVPLAAWLLTDGGCYSYKFNRFIYEIQTIDPECRAYVTGLLDSLSVSYSTRVDASVGVKEFTRIYGRDSKVEDLANRLGLFNRKDTKSIPQEIFDSSTCSKIEFLRSIFEADGYISMSAGPKRGYIGLGSVSLELLRGLRDLLDLFGIASTISNAYKSKRSNRLDSYTLVITHRDDIIRFCQVIGFISTDKNDKLRSVVESKRFLKKTLRSIKVESIEERAFEDVYDLQTSPDGNGTFVVDGLLVHNCFVLPLKDSIEDIMGTARQIALVQRAGGGTGVDLSELRPRDSIVRSSGGTTSGPLSFLKMLSGVTDAIQQGAFRRGANMGTMRIDHPDIIDFIKLKENLAEVTNYNLSVTVPDTFMQMVAEGNGDKIHRVYHPHQSLRGAILRDTGRPVYEGRGLENYDPSDLLTVQEVFDLIVHKAWQSGEPGLIFLDKINDVNPTPNVGKMTSTNPCVTGDTRLHTSRGLVSVRELYETQEDLVCTVDKRSLGKDEVGTETRPAVPVFKTAENAEIFEVTLQSGHRIKATEWHEFFTLDGKKKLKDLTFKDSILLQSGEGQFGSEGSYEEGLLLGLIAGDGHFTNRGNGKIAAVLSLWNEDRDLASQVLETVNSMVTRKVGITEVTERNEVRIRSVKLAEVLNDRYGFNKETKLRVPEVVFKGSRECVRGYLQGLFTADGTINKNGSKCSARLASSNPEFLREVQMLVSNFGCVGRIHKRSRS